MGTCTGEFGSYEAQALPFRKALHRFPSGVAVVTIAEGTWERGKIASPLVHGMTASSLANVSLDPPLLAVSVDNPGLMHRLLAGTDGIYGVSILSQDQVDVADFYARLPWSVAPHLQIEWHGGGPVIAGAHAWFLCREWASYDGGDHAIFVGESIGNGASDRPDTGPLLLHTSEYHTLGSALRRRGRPKASEAR
jgi:flavin reductase (DIM6/NTAB) family NADH-FMN oxidoreductase RutF